MALYDNDFHHTVFYLYLDNQIKKYRSHKKMIHKEIETLERERSGGKSRISWNELTVMIGQKYKIYNHCDVIISKYIDNINDLKLDTSFETDKILFPQYK